MDITKRIRAINWLFSSFLVALLLLYCSNKVHSQNIYKKELQRAAYNTYKTGSFQYNLEYGNLTSQGDTIKDHFNVFVKNTRRELSFSAKNDIGDCFIYSNDTLLFVDNEEPWYKKEQVLKDDVHYEVDFMFQPFFNLKFINVLLSDSVEINKLYEDKFELSYYIQVINPQELDELGFSIVISKSTESIIEYSILASVAGIKIWENWKITKIQDYYKKSSLEKEIKSLYSDMVSSHEPYQEKSNASLGFEIDTNFIAKVLPSLTLISIAGDSFIMQKQHYKYYLIDFWYRSCMPCIKSLPDIIKIYDKYSSKGLLIISINNVDKSNPLIEKFIVDNQIPYKVYIESLEQGKKFNIKVYPTFLIYDEKFNLVQLHTGYSDHLFDKISAFLDSKLFE